MLPRTPPPPPPLMESEMLQSPLLGLGDEDEADLTDWNLPLAFMKKRHCEKIEGSKSLAQSWRMKDRVSGLSLRLLDLDSFYKFRARNMSLGEQRYFFSATCCKSTKKHKPFQTPYFYCKWKSLFWLVVIHWIVLIRFKVSSNSDNGS